MSQPVSVKRFDFLYYVAALLLQGVGVVVAILAFSKMDSRLQAGVLAGSVFVLVGIGTGCLAVARKTWRRSPMFYLALIHLFGISIPLMVTRLNNPTLDFELLHILGMSGPTFHKLSERVYSVMMLATLVEGGWFFLRARLPGIESKDA